MQLEVTFDLIALGGAASVLVEVLRALLLDLERYPKVKAAWPMLPGMTGALLVQLAPWAVPSAQSPLTLGLYGFLSPLAFMAAYPLLKRAITSKTTNLFSEREDK
jgi:hypothetical protein